MAFNYAPVCYSEFKREVEGAAIRLRLLLLETIWVPHISILSYGSILLDVTSYFSTSYNQVICFLDFTIPDLCFLDFTGFESKIIVERLLKRRFPMSSAAPQFTHASPDQRDGHAKPLPGRPVSQCTHIKTNGEVCGSPAVSGTEFCYHHSAVKTALAKPPRQGPV